MRMNWSPRPIRALPRASDPLRVALGAIGMLGLLVVAGCTGSKDDCIYGCGPGGADGPPTPPPTTRPPSRSIPPTLAIPPSPRKPRLLRTPAMW